MVTYLCAELVLNGLSDIIETLALAGVDEIIYNNRRDTPAQVAERYNYRHREFARVVG